MILLIKHLQGPKVDLVTRPGDPVRCRGREVKGQTPGRRPGGQTVEWTPTDPLHEPVLLLQLLDGRLVVHEPLREQKLLHRTDPGQNQEV